MKVYMHTGACLYGYMCILVWCRGVKRCYPYVGGCGEAWGGVGRCGEAWGGVGRCGKVWGGVGRCGEV